MVAAAKRPHVVIRTDPSINELVIGELYYMKILLKYKIKSNHL